MILSAIQPSFIPWRGYFDIIHKSDVFVFYDDTQYERRSWRNRNQIKTANGRLWLTVPVLTKGKYDENIQHICIDNTQEWKSKHLESIKRNYLKTPYFEQYFDDLRAIYNQDWLRISDFDMELTRWIACQLGITVRWELASGLGLSSKRTDRLVEFCTTLKADHYLSGPSARNYIEENKFSEQGIKLEYQVYEYPEYPQLFGQFDGNVSIIDLLFNCGIRSAYYIWGWREEI